MRILQICGIWYHVEHNPDWSGNAEVNWVDGPPDKRVPHVVTLPGELFKPWKEEEENSGILLPGWQCSHCGSFNGEAKEKRTECRSCGAPK